LKKPYKYYSGLTSQLPFCSTPLRLDPYNNCQFGCAYCFAASRQGYGRELGLQIANPKSLRDRLARISVGDVKSALDEFIQQRIPFQLGGMSDPFSPIEIKKGVTLEYLKILAEYDYPVMISTKSDLISTAKYFDIVKNSNILIRFSTTVIDPTLRPKVDKGCSSLNDIYKATSKLVNASVPVSFRLQPIIPSNEIHGLGLIDTASNLGVKHISAEFLKVPIDANKKFGANLSVLMESNPIAFYQKLGAKLEGREFILPLSYRQQHLVEWALKARKNNITFGFADNDLLIHSDGASCCNASNLYLRNSSVFEANIVSLAKTKKHDEEIHFTDYLSSWVPEHAISTYLNSKARIAVQDQTYPNWLGYLFKIWNGQHGQFSPSYFDGVQASEKNDSDGQKIYLRYKSSFEKLFAT
jgi:DNA repair photolyase